jgi:glutamate--cysteine ligase
MLSNDYPGGPYLVGLKRDKAPVTLEPGGQIEVSVGPCSCVHEISVLYNRFTSELEPILKEFGYELVRVGYHPSSLAKDIPLIPKKRYEYMDETFKTTGNCGKNMMRASASTQISVDFENELDCKKKLQISNAIAPFIALLCDNTQVFEKRQLASTERMARFMLWSDLDPNRCGPTPILPAGDSCYSDYASIIMNRPIILLTHKGADGESETIFTRDKTVAEIFADRLFTEDELEHILSMPFFDVRIKTYLEIRMADSMPLEYAYSFAAFIKGLFYNNATI